MKKIFLIPITVLLCCMICACSNNKYELYTVYEIGGDVYISDANHASEITLNSDFYKKIKLIKNKKVEVFGEEYEVTYTDTRKDRGYDGETSEIDFYEYKGDTYSIVVHIDPETDELTAWHKYEKKYKNNGEIKNEEECLKIAFDYLSDYVDDIKCYQLVQSNKIGTIYDFRFYRFIDGMKTSDIASIGVRDNGNVFSVDIENLGNMKNAVLPNEETLSKVRTNVDTKLDEIYGGIYDTHTVSYGEKDEMLLRLSDGSYAIECKVEVTVTAIASDEPSVFESTKFIIYLD